jgi:hypothetical protein
MRRNIVASYPPSVQAGLAQGVNGFIEITLILLVPNVSVFWPELQAPLSSYINIVLAFSNPRFLSGRNFIKRARKGMSIIF